MSWESEPPCGVTSLIAMMGCMLEDTEKNAATYEHKVMVVVALVEVNEDRPTAPTLPRHLQRHPPYLGYLDTASFPYHSKTNISFNRPTDLATDRTEPEREMR
jgi:hypothetical protein